MLAGRSPSCVLNGSMSLRSESHCTACAIALTYNKSLPNNDLGKVALRKLPRGKPISVFPVPNSKRPCLLQRHQPARHPKIRDDLSARLELLDLVTARFQHGDDTVRPSKVQGSRHD